MSRIRCMKDLAIFSALDIAERNRIGELACKKLYKKNEFLFREGDPADTIYLIKSGKVKLFKVSSGGKEIILDILKEDDLLGENTFFDQAEHNMNAQAIEDTYICSCTKDDFTLLLQHAETSLKIIRLLGAKLNSFTSQMASIAFNDVKGRVASMLLKLAEEYGSQSPDGVTIEIDLTHNDLASLVNASRVMVSNVVGMLRQDRIISTKGHRFIILNSEGLNTVVENAFYHSCNSG